jgi:hypothetical protein
MVLFKWCDSRENDGGVEKVRYAVGSWKDVLLLAESVRLEQLPTIYPFTVAAR